MDDAEGWLGSELELLYDGVTAASKVRGTIVTPKSETEVELVFYFKDNNGREQTNVSTLTRRR